MGEAFDYEIPLASLPKAFGADHGHILAPIPYLHAEAELAKTWAKTWAERLGPEGFRVGIAWQGSPNIKADTARAVPLGSFAPLAWIAATRLISLQKNSGVEQLAAEGIAFPVESPGDSFDAGPDAFIDAAAVIAGLDLVITCDTSIAHLAGALGKPVWVALKSVPDWRWMLGREDTPLVSADAAFSARRGAANGTRCASPAWRKSSRRCAPGGRRPATALGPHPRRGRRIDR